MQLRRSTSALWIRGERHPRVAEAPPQPAPRRDHSVCQQYVRVGFMPSCNSINLFDFI